MSMIIAMELFQRVSRSTKMLIVKVDSIRNIDGSSTSVNCLGCKTLLQNNDDYVILMKGNENAFVSIIVCEICFSAGKFRDV